MDLEDRIVCFAARCVKVCSALQVDVGDIMEVVSVA